MVNKSTLVALSSLMAVSVPSVSEKLSTSEMRKNSIRANAVEVDKDTEKEIPKEDLVKSNVEDADLITVELSQDGVSTVKTEPKNYQAENNINENKK